MIFMFYLNLRGKILYAQFLHVCLIYREIFQKEQAKKQQWPKHQILTEKQLVRETIW